MHFNKIVTALALGCVVGIVGTGCDPVPEFTDNEWRQIKALEPLKGGPPPNLFNKRYDEIDLAKFGQKIFFDKDVAEAITVLGPSGNVGDIRKVACVNCHDTQYFTDTHQTTTGAFGNNGQIPGLSHGRNYLATNTGQMVNLAWNEWTLWAGTFDGLVEHGTTVWGTSATPLAQAHFMYTKYKDDYNAAFPDTKLDDRLGDTPSVYPATGGPVAIGAAPGPFEALPPDVQMAIHQFRANMGRVFDTYPRMMLTPDSPFQRFVQGDQTALTSAQKRGLRLFIGKAACNDCHNGPTLTDNKFHNVGAPNVTVVPGNMTNVIPNRGRATAVAGQTAKLTALDEDPENPLVFNGASRWSDNREVGKERLEVLRTQDREHCICRRVDPIADAAACGKIVKYSTAYYTQLALQEANETTLDCLVTNESGECTCRKTDADGIQVAIIDKCTDVMRTSPLQSILQPDTRVACMKYDDTLEGMFRTPSLLNVGETAPYFHSGLVQSLEDVIWHYNQGGGPDGTFAGVKSPQIRPLKLTDGEVHDLAEFLRSLTGKSPSQQAEEARAASSDPSSVWDWSKNTSKPPLTGLGGSTGAGGMGMGTGGRGGSTGSGGSTSGSAGSTGTGTGGGVVGGSGGGAGGMGGGTGGTGS
ncbi:MAG TPA: cytochrome c peroxidase [Polyangia bacterium]|jgi:cytochrome c peroxidase|nr:cytochrome c peroxidase [Polyangia bacterium]